MSDDKIAALRADRDNMADLCLLNMDTSMTDLEDFIQARIKWHTDEMKVYADMTCISPMESVVRDHKIYDHKYRKNECEIILKRIKGHE